MKQMKRWISMLLAVTMMLSACPVSVYAETEETEAAETVAVTEEVTEPAETMAATEPAETIAVTEPAETTEATQTTEPLETTDETQPEESVILSEEPAQDVVTEETTEPVVETVIVEEITTSDVAANEAVVADANVVAQGNCGDNLTWVLDQEGTLTISGEGAMENYSNSSQPWNAYREQIIKLRVEASVTTLGKKAFYDCENLRSVYLQEGLLDIGDQAFFYCNGLLDITIPDSVTTVGMDAFSQCNNMLAIYIAGRELPENCGRRWTGGRIVVKDPLSGRISVDGFTCAITSAGTAAILYYTGQAENLVIPTGIRGYPVTQIACRAFEDLDITSVTIPETIQEIGFYAFYNCQYLEEINYKAVNMTLPSEAEYNYIFYEAGKSGSGITVNIGAQVEEIPGHLFNPEYYVYGGTNEHDSDCAPYITNVFFEEGSACQKIGHMSFAFLKKLKTITFRDTAPDVGTNAFEKVSANAYYPAASSEWTLSKRNSYGGNLKWIPVTDEKLESIAVTTQPNKLKYIHNLEKLDTTGGIVTLYYSNGIEVQMKVTEDMVSGFDNTVVGEQTLTVTFGELTTTYKVSISAELLWNLDDNGVLTISGTGKMGDYTSSGAPWYVQRLQVQEVVIGDGVTHIGEYAFNGFSNLKRITIGSDVRTIGKYAFQEATTLEEICYRAVNSDDSTSNNYIFKNAGINGPGITVSVSSQTKRIPGYLFDPHNTSSVYRPNITEVVFEENSVCSEIGDYAFKDCSALSEINLPNSLVSILDGAFNGCGLQNVIIPKGVRTLGFGAFQKSGSLKSVTISESLTSWDSYTFNNCVLLEEIYYNAVRASDYGSKHYRFTNAGTAGNGITLYIGKNVTVLPKYMLYVYSTPPKLTDVVFASDSSCKKIDSYAFGGCRYITSITFPDSLTSFGNEVFIECSALNTLHFTGDVPAFCGDTFSGLTATAYYPADNDTWTEDKLQNYGGTITWEPYGDVYVDTGTCGENLTWTLDDAGVLTISGVGAMEDYITAEEQPWYDYQSSITEIVIENGVTKIGAYAFYGCGWAETLTIGEGVGEIGNYAFYNCTALTELNFHAVSMADLSDFNYVFYKAGREGDGLTVNIGAKVQRIPARLFYPRNSGDSIPKITDVFFAEGSVCREIGREAFNWVLTLEFIEIPSSVTKIGFYTFENCANLTILFPEALPEELGTDWSAGAAVCVNPKKRGVTENGFDYWITQNDEAVIGKYRGTETTVLVPGIIDDCIVTDVSDGAFYEKTVVTVTLPDGIKKIGVSTFEGCENLKQVTIPDPVESIEQSAFMLCENLDTLILPKNLTYIGSQAFSYGSESYRFTGNAPVIDSSAFSNTTATVGYPADDTTWTEDKLQNYGGTITWEPYGTKVIASGTCGENLTWSLDEEGVLTISGTGDMAGYTADSMPWYAYRDSITALNLEEGITSIGAYAFDGCSEVTMVTVPDSVTTIHSRGFANMTSLMSATLGKNLSQVGSPGDSNVDSSPFYHCTSLGEITFTGTTVPVKYGWPFTNVDMGPEITIYVPAESYRAYAVFLSYAVQHAKVTIKDVTEEFQIRDGVLEAYFGDDAEVTIPDTVTTIGYGAFNNNLNLTKVNLHDGVTKIEDYVFCGCANLSEINWSENLTHIGGWSFLHCVGLKEMILPDSVTEIGDYAFSGCSGLTSATFGSGLQSIGYCTFMNCTALSGTLVIPDSVVTIYNYAFDSCKSLSGIIFEGNAPTIKSSAFYRVKATVHYPGNDETWTADKLQKYGGTLTWVPYCSIENSITLDDAHLAGQSSVWIDGVEYAVQTDGDISYVDLPDGNARTMVAYGYHMEDPADIHSRYPVSMQVWTLSNEDGRYAAVRQRDFDDILQYSGMSIRVTGKQGIRMITSIEKSKKNSLITEGLAGYTLKEYGTVVAWASRLEGGNPLVLGQSYTTSNYAYKKGIADPVFAYDGDRMQYTNVLVGFSTEQCKADLAMRPYMILADEAGNEITLYGGIVHRSIGYIAYQNRDVFAAGTDAYEYVWEIIRSVYGNAYDEDYAG